MFGLEHATRNREHIGLPVAHASVIAVREGVGGVRRNMLGAVVGPGKVGQYM